MAGIARHIIFKGRVQGVGFRFTVHRIAIRCELTGYVKNLPDGSVEVFAQGRQKDIADCIRDIQESFHGQIRETIENESTPQPQYSAFTIEF